ncbi:MAG: hypothetical protein HY253_10095 [Burkholderiales bacterium]|nr:hypothetical protein [Burkholderiales bacterium]
MSETSPILLLPDAGPLITLAYADALDLLFKPEWQVNIVDMVQHEVTRNQTPTNQKIPHWIVENKVQVLRTKTLEHFQQTQASGATPPRKANLGEFAIQEAMNNFALMSPPPTAVFLFEDHKIARASFLLPDNCRKVSTRSFLQFLEQKQWIRSAAEIERKAILNGRLFSQLRFPPE